MCWCISLFDSMNIIIICPFSYFFYHAHISISIFRINSTASNAVRTDLHPPDVMVLVHQGAFSNQMVFRNMPYFIQRAHIMVPLDITPHAQIISSSLSPPLFISTDYCFLPPANYLFSVGNNGVPEEVFPLAECEFDTCQTITH